MPLLSYSAITNYPFQPFTKIYSSDINSMFSTIQTLLNTTKLDSTNVQAHGLIRNGATSNLAAGTANYAVYNDANGDLTEAASLPITCGGLGFNPSLSSAVAQQVIAVNATGTALQLQAVPATPGTNVFNYYQFS